MNSNLQGRPLHQKERSASSGDLPPFVALVRKGRAHKRGTGADWLLRQTPGDKRFKPATSHLGARPISTAHPPKLTLLWWNVTTQGAPLAVCLVLPAVPGVSGSSELVRASFGISFFLTLESHSFSVLMLMNDTSPLAPVITPSCSQRTIRSISSPSFHLRYLPTKNPGS